MQRVSERSNPKRKPRFPRLQNLQRRREAFDFDRRRDDDDISTNFFR